MMRFFLLFILSYLFFVTLDLLWIGVLMKQTYIDQLKPLLRLSNGSYDVYWVPALLVWASIVLGVLTYVLPKTQHMGLLQTFLCGALYGGLLYAVYDLTNYSLLNGWPLLITCIDICWGAIINGLLACFATWLAQRLY